MLYKKKYTLERLGMTKSQVKLERQSKMDHITFCIKKVLNIQNKRLFATQAQLLFCVCVCVCGIASTLLTHKKKLDEQYYAYTQ